MLSLQAQLFLECKFLQFSGTPEVTSSTMASCRQDFNDEKNWSVFRRRTQDPPIDEITSIYASLNTVRSLMFFPSSNANKLANWHFQ